MATDVASRGLDIPEVDLVIQCEPPKVSRYHLGGVVDVCDVGMVTSLPRVSCPRSVRSSCSATASGHD